MMNDREEPLPPPSYDFVNRATGGHAARQQSSRMSTAFGEEDVKIQSHDVDLDGDDHRMKEECRPVDDANEFEPVWLPIDTSSSSSFSSSNAYPDPRLTSLLRSRDIPLTTWIGFMNELSRANQNVIACSSSSSNSINGEPPISSIRTNRSPPTVSSSIDKLSSGVDRATRLLDPIPLVGPLTGSLTRLSFGLVTGSVKIAGGMTGVSQVVDVGLKKGKERREKKRMVRELSAVDRKGKGVSTVVAGEDEQQQQQHASTSSAAASSGVYAREATASTLAATYESLESVIERWNQEVIFGRGIRV